MTPVETRERVLLELRRSPHTVRELAEELGVTSNAVRDHIDVLEGRGLVETAGLRRGTGGKPARIWELTAEGEESFGRAYRDLLHALLDGLESELDEGRLAGILDDVGRSLAREIGGREGDLESRLERAVEVLDEMGGLAEVELSGERAAIVGSGCPLSALVREHPEVCRVAEALVGEITDRPVRERCDREGRPACRFEVGPVRGDDAEFAGG